VKFLNLVFKEYINNAKSITFYLIKWLIVSLVVGIIVGSLSAFFLVSLDFVTIKQTDYRWLLFLLPFGGAFISFLYKRFGNNAIKGNNLIIEQANGEEENIPLRLVPLTLFGTLVTHLFGGSAGREGTAVQMGGAVAEFTGKIFKLNKFDRKIIIICGISAGFSSVFGTPLAGTIFGLEVLSLGLIKHDALVPSFLSAFFANIVTLSYGVNHTHYSIGVIPELNSILVIKLITAGIAFGIVGLALSRSIIIIKKFYIKWMPDPVIRSFVGGIVIILLAFLVGTRDYLGLSLPLLQQAFDGTSEVFAFLWKLVFTAFTLGAGFQGGEVTPLFEIGATFGSTLSTVLMLPTAFLAALGFIGVFTGATNTPITCFIMGVELFGSEGAVYIFLICVISYLFSGNSGIYSSQIISIKKGTFTNDNGP
jgi:H+/Cl- antiporter ClcA